MKFKHDDMDEDATNYKQRSRAMTPGQGGPRTVGLYANAGLWDYEDTR